MDSQEVWLAVGSGSSLVANLARCVDKLVVLGRGRPSYEVSEFVEIGDLTKLEARNQAAVRLRGIISQIDSPVHVLFAQGLSTTDWEDAFAVNLMSVGEMCMAVVEANPLPGSSITLVGSASAYLGGKMPYAASKAGLTGVMAAINQRTAGAIRCNLVVPGAFDGKMTADWDDKKRTLVSERTAIGRLAAADEIVQAIIAMATNAYAVGVLFNMTGGQVWTL